MSDLSTYPALGYAFSVSAVNSDGLSSALSSVETAKNVDAEFQSIRGIKAKRETVNYRALGMNNYSFQLPKTTQYEDLVLERGVVKSSSDFINWCNSFINMDASDSASSSNNALSTKIILVFLWDRNKMTPLMTWTFYNAYPKAIEYSGISAKDSAFAVETITIAYSHFSTLHTPI
jgi:phage tail-like protein